MNAFRLLLLATLLCLTTIALQGWKLETVELSATSTNYHPPVEQGSQKVKKKKRRKHKKRPKQTKSAGGYLAGAIICFVFGGLAGSFMLLGLIVLGFGGPATTLIISFVCMLLFLGLAILFLVLRAKERRENPVKQPSPNNPNENSSVYDQVETETYNPDDKDLKLWRNYAEHKARLYDHHERIEEGLVRKLAIMRSAAPPDQLVIEEKEAKLKEIRGQMRMNELEGQQKYEEILQERIAKLTDRGDNPTLLAEKKNVLKKVQNRIKQLQGKPSGKDVYDAVEDKPKEDKNDWYDREEK